MGDSLEKSVKSDQWLHSVQKLGHPGWGKGRAGSILAGVENMHVHACKEGCDSTHWLGWSARTDTPCRKSNLQKKKPTLNSALLAHKHIQGLCKIKRPLS